MLVLSRKIGEEIEIEHEGERMTLRVCELRQGQAKLGFNAPPAFRIVRQELTGYPSKESRLKAERGKA